MQHSRSCHDQAPPESLINANEINTMIPSLTHPRSAIVRFRYARLGDTMSVV